MVGFKKLSQEKGAPRSEQKLEPWFMLEAEGWVERTLWVIEYSGETNAGRLDVFSVLHIAGLPKRDRSD